MLHPGVEGCAPRTPRNSQTHSAPGPSQGPRASVSLTPSRPCSPPRGSTYLQELDAVAGSPDGENIIRAQRGTPRDPPLQHQFRQGTGVTVSQEGQAGCCGVGVF